MRLTVVGCSGSYPGPRGPASCYLLEADGVDPADPAAGPRPWRVLLDLGSGALGELHRHVDPLTVDAVLLSHLHADHCLDLCGYYVMRKYHPSGAQPRLPVWGPSDTAGRMARAYDLPVEPGMDAEFDFRRYEGAFTLGPFRVEPVRVEHPVEAYALRVTAGGRTLTYTGDTAPCAGLDGAARGADLLLAEASFRCEDDNPDGVHLTGTECGRVAREAGVPRLVLTHVPPWFDPRTALAEASAVHDGIVELAEPGAVYELG